MARLSRTQTALARTSSEHVPNYIYDVDNVCIGLASNIPEQTGDAAVTPSAILSATRPITIPHTRISCGVFWYQDFGLEYTRSNSPTTWMGWYDWRWNHSHLAGHNQQGYFKDRHPSLGWYQGDNVDIQKWQVKWMLEHGCTWAVLQQRTTTIDTGAWSTSSNIAYWVYQLMVNVPAVVDGTFQVALWVPQSDSSGASALAPTNGNWSSGVSYTTGQTVINTAFDNRQYVALRNNLAKQPNSNPLDWAVLAMPSSWSSIASFYAAYSTRIKTIIRNGKIYPVMFFFEGETCRAAWGSGSWRIWLQELGAALNAANPTWEGVAVLVRASPTPSICDGVAGSGLINYDTAETNRAFIIRSDYNGTDASSGASGSYQSLIDQFPTFSSAGKAEAIQRRAYTVPTSLKSIPPHSSTFDYPGHTPTKFGEFVTKVMTKLETGEGYPLLLISNVSEWAESGPGLQPNKQDGFGYLTALKQAIVSI